MEAFLTNPIVTEVLKYLIVALLVLILSNIRRMNNRLTYIDYKLIATDYALEKHMQNGYAKNRNEKLAELVSKNNFINATHNNNN